MFIIVLVKRDSKLFLFDERVVRRAFDQMKLKRKGNVKWKESLMHTNVFQSCDLLYIPKLQIINVGKLIVESVED